jgi:uncharacterized protein YggE
MSAEPLISVRGEAVLEVDPEIAVVRIGVMASDKDRGRALDLLAARNAEVLAVVKAYGEAVEKLASEPAWVAPVLKDNRPRERVAGYHARGGLEVTVRDFGILGDLVIRTAGTEQVTVTGPWWQLRPDSPVRREARRAAAADALRRARDYADAFGGRVTGLVEMADQELLAESSGMRHPFRAAAARSADLQADAAPQLDLEPAKQVVRGQVEARFTMTQPDLAG